MKKEYDFSQGKRGAVIPTPKGKTRITIRIDTKILNWFRKTVDEQGGGSYQAMINQALYDYIEKREKPIEETLRRIIREEMRHSA